MLRKLNKVANYNVFENWLSRQPKIVKNLVISY